MHLPYYQLADEFLTKDAPVIAGLLRAHIPAGVEPLPVVIGLGSLLFAYAVDATSSETKPPDGMLVCPEASDLLEAAARWTGERGALVAAFATAHVIERLEIGLRVKGMDRYAQTWKRNRRQGHGRDSAPDRAPADPGGPDESGSPAQSRAGNGGKASPPARETAGPAQSRARDGDGDGDGRKEAPRARDTRVPADLVATVERLWTEATGSPFPWPPFPNNPEERALRDLHAQHGDALPELLRVAFAPGWPAIGSLAQIQPKLGDLRQKAAKLKADATGKGRQTRPAAPGAMKFRDLEPGEDPYAEQAARGPA